MTRTPAVLPRLASRGLLLGRADFTHIAGLMLAVAGHDLGDRIELVRSRLEPLVHASGARSFTEYVELVQVDAAQRVAMTEALCTHETSFFREVEHFHFLRRLALGPIAARGLVERRRHVRVWSAACSTGEEPFSLALALADALPCEDGWAVDVIGTDLASAVLAKASRAVWPLAAAERIPLALRRFVETRDVVPGHFTLAATILRRVTFQQLNLVAELWPIAGRFDVIFCRNVLFYLARARRAQVIEALASHLAADGHLFLGHADSSLDCRGLRLLSPGVYARSSAP